MLHPLQQKRLDRMNYIKKIIVSRGKEGIDNKELKVMLMTHYGFSDRTIDEYLKAIVNSGFAREEFDIIMYEGKSK